MVRECGPTVSVSDLAPSGFIKSRRATPKTTRTTAEASSSALCARASSSAGIPPGTRADNAARSASGGNMSATQGQLGGAEVELVSVLRVHNLVRAHVNVDKRAVLNLLEVPVTQPAQRQPVA